MKTRTTRPGWLMVILFTVLGVVVLRCATFLAFRTSGTQAVEAADLTDALARRDYLLHRLQGDFARDMAAPDPFFFRGEWALGTLSMTTMALCNMAFTWPQTRTEALETIPGLIHRALQPSTRAFDTHRWNEDALNSLAGPHGHIGYLGHLNVMLGCFRLLGGDARYAELHHAITATLVQRMDCSPSAQVETYPEEIYPSDNTVAVASVAIHQRAWGTTKHKESIQRWIHRTRDKAVDATTGLLAFRLDEAGNILRGPRGCGAGWNSFFLPFIDQALAADQFDRLQTWVRQPLPLVTGIREYPPHEEGEGDVDSGPVLLGLSPSGTGFAMAGARRAGDAALLGHLLTTAEWVGTTVPWRGRSYLFAPLVGDAIVLAMRTAVDWDTRFVPQTHE